MKLGDMIKKIQSDLNIPNHRARGFIRIFSEKYYKGCKDAISDIVASYTDEGYLKITYFINNKPNDVLINGNPYDIEKKRNNE